MAGKLNGKISSDLYQSHIIRALHANEPSYEFQPQYVTFQLKTMKK